MSRPGLKKSAHFSTYEESPRQRSRIWLEELSPFLVTGGVGVRALGSKLALDIYGTRLGQIYGQNWRCHKFGPVP